MKHITEEEAVALLKRYAPDEGGFRNFPNHGFLPTTLDLVKSNL